MEWVHQHHVDETVDWFVRTALPDAQPGWEGLPWMVDEMGRTDDHGCWWTIAVDVLTSVRGMPCWLSFRAVEPGGEIRESYVERVHTIRSGRGEHEPRRTSGTTASACGFWRPKTMPTSGEGDAKQSSRLPAPCQKA